ncbi:MAG: DsrE family protein [Deltaproteobacteria bacterium]|nr:DsrE family protein [Deltaproteobacteria bacterium]
MKRFIKLWIFLIIVITGGTVLLTGCAKKPVKEAPAAAVTKPSKAAVKKKITIKKPLLTPASYHGFFNNKVIKVVFQVNSPNPKKWKVALLNMNDIIWELHYNPKRYKVVFVAYGPAVKMFLKKDNKLTPLIEKLYKHKVRFDSCHVAMIKLGIKSKEILPIVHVTPDGFFAILHYEMTGYSYIKP